MRSTRLSTSLIAAAVCLCGLAAPARSQDPFGGAQRPTTSPYLNLLRGRDGGGLGLRYFGVVRPEQQLYRAANQFGRGISDLNQRVDAQQTPDSRSLETSILSPTGHPTTFFSTSQYYPGPQQNRGALRR